MKKTFLGLCLLVPLVLLPSLVSIGETAPGNSAAGCVSASPSPDTTYWARTYGGSDHDRFGAGMTIPQTSDGGYIMVGGTLSYGAGGGAEVLVLKLTSDGSIEWQKTYGGSEHDSADTIQQVADRGYIVKAGTDSFGEGDGDVWLLKLNRSGGIVWQKSYGGSQSDVAAGIQQTKDGGYIIAGTTESYGAGGSDGWVFKLDPNGDIEWQKAYGGIQNDSFNSVQQTTDGGYIIAGITESYGAGGSDGWVLKLAANGTVEWQKTYGGSKEDYPISIRQTMDGGYILGGETESFGAGSYDMWALKLASNGKINWQKVYGGSGQDFSDMIVQTTDGGYIAAGCTESYGAGGGDGWVVKLASNGRIEWQRTYGGSASDWNCTVHESDGGGYIVTGCTYSYGAGESDIWMLKISANGDIPYCAVVASSKAAVANTSVSSSDVVAVPKNTRATAQDTVASVQDCQAVTRPLCPGPHTLNLTATTGGTTDPPAGTYTYDGGVMVAVLATPDAGYYWNGWTGDASGSARPLEIGMDSDKSITANFAKLASDDSGTDKKSGCFIATACYGTAMAGEVQILSSFRDEYLAAHPVGGMFVELYCEFSPAVADFIKDKEPLKIVVRRCLEPVIWIIKRIIEENGPGEEN